MCVCVSEGKRGRRGEEPDGVSADMAAPPDMPIVIDHIALKDILGPHVFEMEVREGRGWHCLAQHTPLHWED